MSKTNIIELNGKKYDAVLGTFLGESTTSAAPGSRQHHIAQGRRTRSIDGFMKPQTSAKSPHATPVRTTPFIAIQSAPIAKTRSHIQIPKSNHAPAKHLAAHQPQHAKTLMRTVVRKPNTTPKPVIKVQAPSEMVAKPANAIEPKPSVTHVNPIRLERAQGARQSSAVRKFSPERTATRTSRPTVTAPVRVAIAAPPARQTQRTAPRDTNTATDHKEDIFEAALAIARSHEQPAPRLNKKRSARRKFVNVFAGVMAAVLIGGFVAYLNMPAIELRVASVKAGFHATLPAYHPVGYTLKDVREHDKQVSIRFHADNGSAFSLTQQPSNWDSSTVYDNLVAINGSTHQTVESHGHTIYVYGNDHTNAVWVTGGVLYQITGNAELNNNQISQLAASL